MCLSHSAHGVEPTHPIFQGPFPVKLSFEEGPTPESYGRYYSGRNLGETMPMWRVDKLGYTEEGAQEAGVEPGVVAGGWGFDDSPDAEVIAGGINSKGPNAVALGRHGSFFHWGFAAAPGGMTESGQRAFLNAIVYIDQFDGAPLLVRNEGRGREVMLDGAWRLMHMRASYDESVAWYKQRREAFDAAKAAEGTRELTDAERSSLRYEPRAPEPWEDYVASQYARFPEALVAELGTEDPAKYLSYYEAHRDYLHGKGYDIKVDQDALALGIPNHDPAILDAALKEWKAGTEVERAKRLLSRYTGESFETPDAAALWLTRFRKELFFSDVGGFRFFTGETPDEVVRRRVLEAPVPAPSRREPVVRHVEVFPAAAAPGDTVTLAVRISVAKGWHMYAEVPEGQAYRTLSVALEESDEYQAMGDWSAPEAHGDPDVPGMMLLDGELVFLQAVRIPWDTEPGTLELGATVSYQVCDINSCLPYQAHELDASVTIE